MDEIKGVLDVTDLLRDALTRIGADGLCGDDCGCGLDDLAPCGCIGPDCLAARCEVLTEPRSDAGVGDLWYSPMCGVHIDGGSKS